MQIMKAENKGKADVLYDYVSKKIESENQNGKLFKEPMIVAYREIEKIIGLSQSNSAHYKDWKAVTGNVIRRLRTIHRAHIETKKNVAINIFIGGSAPQAEPKGPKTIFDLDGRTLKIFVSKNNQTVLGIDEKTNETFTLTKKGEPNE